jgi:hypothetical protein
MSIDTEIFRSSFSLPVEFIKKEVNAENPRSYLLRFLFYYMLYVNKPTVQGVSH